MRPPLRAALVAALVAGVAPLALTSVVNPAQAATTAEVIAGSDSYVDSAHPSSNYGTAATLHVDGSPSLMTTYLRFDLTSYAGQTLTSAQLRIRTGTTSSAGSPNTQTIRTVADDTWSETGLTYSNRPSAGAAIGTLARTSPDTSYTVSLDRSALQAQLGQQLSIAIDQPTSATNGLGLVARQAATSGYRPTLLLQFADTSSPTPTAGTTPAPTPTGTTGEAATTFGWGAPIGGDEFNYTGPPNSNIWSVYNSAGHAGNGVRSPAQVTVNGTALQITGLPDGTTGGMSHRDRGRTYGRWEARMRVNARDPEYHPVMILWPDQGRVSANNCAEIDYSESTSDTSRNRFFLHYGCAGEQASSSQSIDMTQWHNYAVEWTPAHIVGYVDGKEWFRDDIAAQVPDDPAHQTIQLDWFPDGTTTTQSWMQVDWLRLYRAP